jgi:hypothetical protein
MSKFSLNEERKRVLFTSDSSNGDGGRAKNCS